jgi:GWxTD domain-containing protein
LPSIFLILIATVQLTIAFASGANNLQEKYRRWLSEEVVYIISEQERKDFLTLRTDAEREAFIAEFWTIRDPDTSTEENECRQEHYRRIRYANEKFHDGVAGWRTERGRIYIMHGPPDSINFIFGGNPLYIDIEQPTSVITNDSNPDRRRNYRLSFTTPETEVWVYRHLPGAENFAGYFEVMFSRVDPNQLYVLNETMRHLARSANLTYPQRLERDYAVMNFFRGQRVGGPYRILYAGEYKFQDVDEFYHSIFHPERLPTVDVTDWQMGLQDLERSPGEVLQRKLQLKVHLKETVQSRVFFRQFPLNLYFGSLRSHFGATLLPITIGLNEECLGDVLDILIELVGKEGKTVASVVDSFKIDARAKTEPAVGEQGTGRFLYQTQLAARPGDYRLAVYGVLRKRKAVASLNREARLPNYSGAGLSVSDLLLFQKVIPRNLMGQVEKDGTAIPSFLGGSAPLYLKDYVLVPASDTRFRRKDSLTAFFEVYNPGIPKDAKEPALKVKCRFRREGQLLASVPDKFLNYVTENHSSDSQERSTVYGLSIPLRSFYPGDYSLELEVFDEVLNQNVVRETSFSVY